MSKLIRVRHPSLKVEYKLKTRISIISTIGLGLVLGAPLKAKPQTSPGGPIIDTTVCRLRSAPAEFDHKLIRVNAYLSLGFEEAGMHDPFCQENSSTNQQGSHHEEPGFWVEFADHADHEGVKGFLPLVDDAQLRKFSNVLNQRDGQMPRAVLIGTFYAAKTPEDTEPGKISFLGGYGHMGCCHCLLSAKLNR